MFFQLEKIVDFQRLPREIVHHIVSFVVANSSCTHEDVCPVVLSLVCKTFFQKCARHPCKAVAVGGPNAPLVQRISPGKENRNMAQNANKQFGLVDKCVAIGGILESLGFEVMIKHLRHSTHLFVTAFHNMHTRRMVRCPPVLLFTGTRKQGPSRRILCLDVLRIR